VAAIEAGTAGVLRVMGALEMIDDVDERAGTTSTFIRKTHWLRARRAGILHLRAELGDRIEQGEPIGVIHDTFGGRVATVRARMAGVVIGLTRNPLVTQGGRARSRGRRVGRRLRATRSRRGRAVILRGGRRGIIRSLQIRVGRGGAVVGTLRHPR
jgi:predicted deacylase